MNIFNKYFWSDFWYQQISSRIRPRNKWATKCIPRTWCDKTHLLLVFLYASIVDFVEGEKCFEVTDWEWNDKNKEVAVKIKEIYDWIKVGRPVKEKQMWDAYPEDNDLSDIKNWGKNVTKESYEQRYGKVNRLDKEIDEKDTEYLTWIVSHREYLWT